MFSKEFIARVLEATDIVTLIGSDIELKKDGANWKGHCPFHSEKSGSFNVSPAKQIYHCFGCKESGDAAEWLKKYSAMSFTESIEHLAGKAGIPIEPNGNGSPPPRKKAKQIAAADYQFSELSPTPEDSSLPKAPREALEGMMEPAAPAGGGLPRRKKQKEEEPFDWPSMHKAFGPEQAASIAAERGWSPEFVDFLHRAELIAWRRDDVCFPIHKDGEIVGVHYRFDPRDGSKKRWGHFPSGYTAPLVVGDLEAAGQVFAGESQWDMFSLLEKFGYHEDPRDLAVISTRGSTSNLDFSGFEVPSITFVPQNDDPKKKDKNGLTPAEKWLKDVLSKRAPGTRGLIARIPDKHKDANDWIRDDKPTLDAIRIRLIEDAENPTLLKAKTARELMNLVAEGDDPDCMIGTKNRFLSKGGSFIFIGSGGIGKSTLTANMLSHWAAGLSWHGINVRREMKILVIQAENDDRDSGEMLDAAFKSLRESGMTERQIERAQKNLIYVNETEKTGKDWCDWLEGMIRETGADLVLADPLLSYFGDDISQQKACSIFFRNWLNPVLQRTGAIIGFVHHTGKTSSDAKSRAHWSSSDYSYIGLGSSELTNWPRAIMTLLPSSIKEGVFKFSITKRGKRAGMKSGFDSGMVTSIYLAHDTKEGGLGWNEVEEPQPDDEDEPPRKRKQGSGRAKREPASKPSSGSGLSEVTRFTEKTMIGLKYLPTHKVPFSFQEAMHCLEENAGFDRDMSGKILISLTKRGFLIKEGGMFQRTDKK